MSIAKKERWTEAEVLALPAGEHDYFDRKSGQILADSQMEAKLAKALSAFANSGGGHLLLGVKNNGTFDGVDPQHAGRTPTREWLEQLIPNLLDFPLEDFRVHEAAPSSDSAIPAGRTVIVVDVADSERAPHQSQRDKLYYVRIAGKSAPAPHRMVEDIRNRARHPNIVLRRVEIIDVYKHGQQRADSSGLLMQSLHTTLKWTLGNDGPLKAANCCLLTMGENGVTFRPDQDYAASIDARPVDYWRGAFWELRHPIYPRMVTEFRCGILIPTAVWEPVSGILHFVLPGTTETVAKSSLCWTIFADNAPATSGKTTLSNLGFSSFTPR